MVVVVSVKRSRRRRSELGATASEKTAVSGAKIERQDKRNKPVESRKVSCFVRAVLSM